MLDFLMDQEVLNEGEYEELKEASSSKREKALQFVDTVRKKGPKASEKFVQSILKEDPNLAQELGLDS
uniref:Caspase 1 n=2 Tax=Latimeria TaxID=7896 RepID=X2D2D8_LATME|nr:Caspase 1 [Latimeria menadoensis]